MLRSESSMYRSKQPTKSQYQCCCCALFVCLLILAILLAISYMIFISTIDHVIDKNLFKVFRVESSKNGVDLRQKVSSDAKSMTSKSVGLFDGIEYLKTMHVVNSGPDEIFMQCYWNKDSRLNSSTVVLVSNPIHTSIPAMGDDKMLKMTVGFKRNTCFYDYSGNGYSSGSPTEKKLYANIESVFKKLTDTTYKGGYYIPKNKIVLYGHSLGASLSVDLASKTRGIGGIILIAPFLSVFSLGIADQVVASTIPNWAVKSLDPFRNDKKISKITDCPFLIVRGNQDKDVPFSHAKQLMDNLKQAGNEKIEFAEIDSSLDYSFNATTAALIDHEVNNFFQKYDL